ncbi:dihydrofolate reductase family protein [Pedobacter nutrimenti]|uniref:dihydrofolate reductase family protein n=1 Tax=Pedobacter nutrimenti TaxID=1241337 RepID=UPI002930453B|nr:dihydrofolate reductase family protein [Pedobacter nutrimenti]
MKTSIYIAISANGLISNSRNVPDWLSPEYGQGMYSICQQFKAVIMGKTTYDIIAPDYLPLKNDGITLVLTTHEDEKPANPTVNFTKANPHEIIQRLTDEGYEQAVIIGGTMTISQFIKSGVVDDIYFIIEPVLFDGGLPLLKNATSEVKLNLLNVNKLNNNTIQLHYQVQKN